MLALLAALAAPALAHLGMWHPSAYGGDAADLNQNSNALPLRNRHVDGWMLGGERHQPPEGEYLLLPAGSVLHAEISCNKGWTTYGPFNGTAPSPSLKDQYTYACADPPGAMHTEDPFPSPLEALQDVKGCAIAIAYASNPANLGAADFSVISTNAKCPFLRKVDFAMPPRARAGSSEMYQVGYRCRVVGQIGSRPLARAQVARKCPYDKNNCTLGAKQPLIWMQAQGNNMVMGTHDPPVYNAVYGFGDGAQTDLWTTDTGATWNQNGSADALAPEAYWTYGESYSTTPRSTGPGEATLAVDLALADASWSVPASSASTASMASDSSSDGPHSSSPAAAQVDSLPTHGATALFSSAPSFSTTSNAQVSNKIVISAQQPSSTSASGPISASAGTSASTPSKPAGGRRKKCKKRKSAHLHRQPTN